MTRIKIYNLENYLDLSCTELADNSDRSIVERLFAHDHTLWSNDPTEISNRLGWLDCPEHMLGKTGEINSFVAECIKAGFKKVLLLGMGGSSLAPELFNEIFYINERGMELKIADSTHPDKVAELNDYFDPNYTLYIVSTKSGGTVETISQMNYFYNRCAAAVGVDVAGSHFVAITDPGSNLEEISAHLKFRRCFLNDPNIGGRFSVLSYFGIVPAAVVGADINKLLSGAAELKKEIQNMTIGLHSNPLWLGTMLGLLANKSRDKLSFIISKDITNFGDWLEQLIAESSGKEGKGILPVLESVSLNTEHISGERLFVCISLNDDPDISTNSEGIMEKGLPLIYINLDDKYDLGSEFYRWEIITSIACRILGVNPFDQPNVESAKIQAKKFLDDYKEHGLIREPEYFEVKGGFKVIAEKKTEDLSGVINSLIHTEAESLNGYISVQAYLPQTLANAIMLGKIKHYLNKKSGLPVTIGFGPRFLHSTGQLHKGDSGNGLFIQIVSEPMGDINIPESAEDDKSSLSFGTLIKAQYLGDRKALIDSGRKVITINIGSDVQSGLNHIVNSIRN